ncbi:MAG: histidine phosphatase family protein [Clostridia bacterium]|nr:histidine phosphatase family protein [Clostridia bacterium]NCC43340.1 histidine phosphatase family protein [Clostridia bacterium]
MKIIIIRHADPDYTIDSLTPKGWREAELLSHRIVPMDVQAFYQSPLGRARDTASVSLKKMRRTAETLDWLREFHAPVLDELTGERRIPWDQFPQKWTSIPEYYDKDQWANVPLMAEGNVGQEAARVYAGLDALLSRHGYERSGNLYHTQKGNTDTIVLFCHFGVECVMLGHLLGISPVVLWQGFCAAPSSVTTLTSEERQEGIACFRMSSFGDISHLYAKNEEPAFAARFCETYDSDQRHD